MQRLEQAGPSDLRYLKGLFSPGDGEAINDSTPETRSSFSGDA